MAASEPANSFVVWAVLLIMTTQSFTYVSVGGISPMDHLSIEASLGTEPTSFCTNGFQSWRRCCRSAVSTGMFHLSPLTRSWCLLNVMATMKKIFFSAIGNPNNSLFLPHQSANSSYILVSASGIGLFESDCYVICNSAGAEALAAMWSTPRTCFLTTECIPSDLTTTSASQTSGHQNAIS